MLYEYCCRPVLTSNILAIINQVTFKELHTLTTLTLYRARAEKLRIKMGNGDDEIGTIVLWK